MIKILVDSASDLSLEQSKTNDFLFIPLNIQLENKEYQDGIDIEKDDYFELLTNTTNFPKTSQPSPQKFLEIFEQVKKDQDTLIYLAISSKLSGTYQSANIAKDLCEYENIHIIDTLSAAAGITLLAMITKQYIEKGMQVEEIVSKIENLKNKVTIFATLKTLEYLQRGGRISKTVATVGNLARVKPIITLSQGEVNMLDKSIGMKKSFDKMLEHIKKTPIDKDYPIYSIFSYGVDNCEKFESMIEIDERYQIGATIGSHIGPGAYGIIYIKK